jgi:hypothetical protein
MKIDEFRKDPVVADGNQKINIASGASSAIIKTCAFPLLKLYFPANWTTCDVSFQESDDGVNWYDTSIETGAGVAELVSVNVVASECRSYGYFLIGAQYIRLNCSIAQANNVVIKAVLAPLYGRL